MSTEYSLESNFFDERVGPTKMEKNSMPLSRVIAVQLRREDSGAAGYDCETAGAGDRMQNHGARERLDEGQEEGKNRLKAKID